VNTAPKRVSPIHAPDSYLLPERPEGASDSVLDAFRQTQFVLGGELKLFAEAMNLQLQVMRDAYPSQYRTLKLAAIAGLWSRAYQCLADATLLLTRASYSTPLALIRSAAELMAAEESLRVGDGEEYANWSANTLVPSVEHKAVEFDLGRFFAGSVLASDAELGSVYRRASDLGRPNFGATLLQVAPESNNQRLAITFADTTFHLGWAEIVLGFLLRLACRQVQLAIDAEPLFPITAEVRTQAAALAGRLEDVLTRDDRCYVDEIDDGGSRRYLVHNFRRTSGGAPKKVLL
jgi:hypothetical protein